MTRVVLDTNILVASLWKPYSKSAGIVRGAIERRLVACYDQSIMDEYAKVLRRFKFRFPVSDIEGLLQGIAEGGLLVDAPKSDFHFAHESDRVFYDVARHSNAMLITSNLRHYPNDDPLVITPGGFAACMKNVF